eukprot:7382291-Prymnesium_polylepis.3
MRETQRSSATQLGYSQKDCGPSIPRGQHPGACAAAGLQSHPLCSTRSCCTRGPACQREDHCVPLPSLCGRDEAAMEPETVLQKEQRSNQSTPIGHAARGNTGAPSCGTSLARNDVGEVMASPPPEGEFELHEAPCRCATRQQRLQLEPSGRSQPPRAQRLTGRQVHPAADCSRDLKHDA